MRYAIIKYSRHCYSRNLGDEIQSIAASQFVPENPLRIPRTSMRTPDDYACVALINGFFGSGQSPGFPPPANITPAYAGFHIADHGLLTTKTQTHFKKHAPIGCRDRETYAQLAQRGINAYFGKCLTLTLPKRTEPPQDPHPVVVIGDWGEYPEHQKIPSLLPPQIRASAKILDHKHDLDARGHAHKTDLAIGLLSYYRKRASLIVTNRLHCALPCVAMGIPVVFIADPKSTRLALAGDVGLKIYPYATPSAEIDWQPQPLDIDAQKRAIITATENALARAVCIAQTRKIRPSLLRKLALRIKMLGIAKPATPSYRPFSAWGDGRELPQY